MEFRLTAHTFMDKWEWLAQVRDPQLASEWEPIAQGSLEHDPSKDRRDEASYLLNAVTESFDYLGWLAAHPRG